MQSQSAIQRLQTETISHAGPGGVMQGARYTNVEFYRRLLSEELLLRLAAVCGWFMLHHPIPPAPSQHPSSPTDPVAYCYHRYASHNGRPFVRIYIYV